MEDDESGGSGSGSGGSGGDGHEDRGRAGPGPGRRRHRASQAHKATQSRSTSSGTSSSTSSSGRSISVPLRPVQEALGGRHGRRSGHHRKTQQRNILQARMERLETENAELRARLQALQRWYRALCDTLEAHGVDLPPTATGQD